jgi:hypothetical protein
VYRKAAPPKFVTFPGMFEMKFRLFHQTSNIHHTLSGRSKLQPGFEVICKIKADLTACLNAHPVLKSKDNGREYKKIEVRTLSMSSVAQLI